MKIMILHVFIHIVLYYSSFSNKNVIVIPIQKMPKVAIYNIKILYTCHFDYFISTLS